jgi:hypothetical protein
MLWVTGVELEGWEAESEIMTDHFGGIIMGGGKDVGDSSTAWKRTGL